MSATPHRDAVEAWIAGGRVGPILWPEVRWPDPPQWSDPAVRLIAAVQMCASGARAELPRRPALINGKLIPPPPERRPSRRGRRKRPPKPRKRETQP